MTGTTERARNAVARRTEAAAAASGSEVAKREPATLEQKIQAMEGEFARAMPRGVEAAQLVRDGLTALRKVRDLAKCEHTSVLGGLMVCAQLGLRPGPMDLIHLIPFWDSKDRIHKAVVVVDYKGFVQLAARAGTRVIAREVREYDDFDYAYGLDDKLVHKPARGRPRGEATDYYAVAKWGDGQYAFIVWPKADIEAHRDRYSKAWKKDGEKSIWGTNFDDQARKTMVRQLRKWIPLSVEMVAALTVDGTVQTDLRPDSLDMLPPTYDDPDVIDAEVVDSPTDNAAGGSGPDKANAQAGPAAAADATADPERERRRLFAVLGKLGLTGDAKRDDRLAVLAALTRRPITSSDELTAEEVETAAGTLDAIAHQPDEQERALTVAELVTDGRAIRAAATSERTD